MKEGEAPLTPIEVAYRAFPGQFKVKDNEIIPTYCPFCKGGQSGDRDTFQLNINTGLYFCRRGKCQEKGNLEQLCQHFGIQIDRKEYEPKKKKPKPYTPPKTKPKPITSEIEKYLTEIRKLSKDTCDYLRIGESEGKIVFPYYENGQLVAIKFRGKNEDGKWKKFSMEPGGKLVFWNMDNCDPEQPLFITEGECFPGNTEILTETGWKRFDEYNNGKVMQVTSDLGGMFVVPTAIIKKPFDGELFQVNRGGNYTSITTPGHNIVYRDYKNRLCKKPVKDMPKTVGRGHIPTTITLSGKGINLSEDQIALCLAVSADATVDYRKNTGRKKAISERYVRFGLKKRRKIVRLRGILDRLGITPSDNEITNEYTSICFPLPDWCIGKELPFQWLVDATLEQREFILSEMVHWDGNHVHNRTQTEYSSKIYSNALFMQTLAHTSGRMSTIMNRQNQWGKWFKVSILHTKNHVSWQQITPKKIPYNGIVYCVNVPSGMILVRQNGHITVTGNCDTAALVEAGITNAVSLPNGCESLGCVDLCWEWLQQFKKYYIWTDTDEGGIKAREELVKRLGIGKCYIVEYNEKFKDANAVLYKYGKEGVARCVSNAQGIPLVGLKDMAHLPDYDLAKDELIPTGIIEVDEVFAGGLRLGETSIWTGFNSSGKSTLLGQILLNALENGYKICAYSGELPDRIFRYWIELQAAGPEFVKQETNKYGYPVSKTDYKMLPHIRAWYEGRFWLYDTQEAVGQDDILKVFEYAVQRHDCKVFMVDNLMSLALNSHSDSDFYRKQADFIGMCKAFAKKYMVHIHIVAHPRKPSAGSKELDVAGSGNITNWTDNVFEIKRFTKKEIATIETEEGMAGLGITNSLNVKKNRILGKQDKVFMLAFEDKSKRYYIAKGGNPNWAYSWVKAIGKQSTSEVNKEWEELGKVRYEE